MKAKQITISIAEPCHENWQNMTPNEQGRYCSICEKTVMDFTQKTDKQLLDFYNQNGGKLCGRFKSTQLNKPIVAQSEPQFPLPLAAAASVLFSFMNPQSAHAQVVKEDTKISTRANQENNFVIKGKVKFKLNDEDLIGANIYCKELNLSTATDVEGNFELNINQNIGNIKDSIILECKYAGFLTNEVKYFIHENAKPLIIEMVANPELMKQVVIDNHVIIKIKGIVFDSLTGLPLQNAQIRRGNEDEKIFLTTQNGQFVISSNNGTSNITVTHEGYETKNISIENQKENQIFLSPIVIENRIYEISGAISCTHIVKKKQPVRNFFRRIFRK
jgi:hypothetical protein